MLTVKRSYKVSRCLSTPTEATNKLRRKDLRTRKTNNGSTEPEAQQDPANKASNEDTSILRCCNLSTGKEIPTFRRTVERPYQRQEVYETLQLGVP